MWGIFLECTEEILSVGDISRVYRRDPQCGGFQVCTEEIPSVGDISRVYRRDPQCGGYF